MFLPLGFMVTARVRDGLMAGIASRHPASMRFGLPERDAPIKFCNVVR
jgi:hypothetical protein